MQGRRNRRTDLLPLAERIWRSEGGPGEAAERAGTGERKLKRLVAELSLDKQVLQDIARGNFKRRRCAVSHARQEHGLTEGHACLLIRQPRGTHRYRPTQREDEDALTRAIIELASDRCRLSNRESWADPALALMPVMAAPKKRQ